MVNTHTQNLYIDLTKCNLYIIIKEEALYALGSGYCPLFW